MSWLASIFADLAARGILPEAFGFPFVVRGLIAVLILAPLLGGMSHLVVARRMAFFSAALGQAALTGVSIGLIAGEPIASPYGGLFGFCFLAAVWMVFIMRRSALPPDTLIGVFLALSLGLGICLLVLVTRKFNIHQIEGVLFGSLLTVSDTDLVVLVVIGGVAAGALFTLYNRLLLDSISSPLAHVQRISTSRIDYVFVLLLTAAIVVSLKIIGALLVEAFVIVPAAAARNVATSARSSFVIGIGIAFISGIAGISLSAVSQVPTGGAVVLAMTALFFV
ncbi:MAG TPA: metal ABC transporter permease, partial [Myxococcota bacterium]